MSAPNPCVLKDDDGRVLSRFESVLWSWQPLSRKYDEAGFLCAVGEFLAIDIAAYCAGQLENCPNPTFALPDIALIELEGGKVAREEFALCLDAYIQSQQDCIEQLKAILPAGEADFGDLPENIASAEQVKAALEAIQQKHSSIPLSAPVLKPAL